MSCSHEMKQEETELLKANTLSVRKIRRLSKKIRNKPKMEFQVTKDPGSPAGRRIRINVTKREGFSAVQAKRHQSAADAVEVVINSLEFKQAVTKIKSFVSSSKNGVQVYDKIMTGEETLQRGVDYEFDVHVIMYEENNSTVGYTYENDRRTWVNNKFFKQYTLGEIGANLVHEWLHKAGFDHTAEWTEERKNSVPYRIGYLVGDMVDEMLAGKKYTDLYPVVVEVPIKPVPTPENPTPKPVPTPVVVTPPPPQKKVCKRLWYTFWTRQVCWLE